VCDPSSGSTELCLKLLLVVHRYFSCAWPMFGSVILNLLCVCAQYDGLETSSHPVVQTHAHAHAHAHAHTHTHTAGSKLRCQTLTKHAKNICEPLRVISVKHSSVLPDDGSHTIRNILERFLIAFKNLYNVDFNL